MATRKEENVKRLQALRTKSELRRQSLLKSDMENAKAQESRLIDRSGSIMLRLGILGWGRSRCRRHVDLLAAAVQQNDKLWIDTLIRRAPMEFFLMVRSQIEVADKVDLQQLRTLNKFIEIKKDLG